MPNAIDRTFVYVANAESRELLVFRLSPANGELTLIEHVIGGKFTTIAVSPDRRWLFAGLRDEPYGIASLAIDSNTGKLRHVGETRFPGPLAFLSVDRTGRWLLAASYHGDFVAIAEIRATGELAAPHQIIRAIPKAHSVLASPANDFLAAAALGNDRILVWPFDAATGKVDESRLSEVGVDAGTGPRHLRFHSSAQRMFLIGELDASVRLFEYDAARNFKQLSKSFAIPKGFRSKRWGAELQLAPDGNFVFASERTSSTLSAFAVNDAAQSLELRAVVQTEQQPRAFALDPTGRYLFVAGQKSNRLSAYAIDQQTGVPTKLAEYAVGLDPCWIEAVGMR
jgi:6-phosphogluconolactonase